jgi:hypothetical protein
MSEIRSGSNQDLTSGRNFDPNCLNTFLEEIGDDITGACMVPINLPQKEIVNIIKRAKKWFYKKYEYSVKENLVHHTLKATEHLRCLGQVQTEVEVYIQYMVYMT